MIVQRVFRSESYEEYLKICFLRGQTPLRFRDYVHDLLSRYCLSREFVDLFFEHLGQRSF